MNVNKGYDLRITTNLLVIFLLEWVFALLSKMTDLFDNYFPYPIANVAPEAIVRLFQRTCAQAL
jgi:hypothetical protein